MLDKMKDLYERSWKSYTPDIGFHSESNQYLILVRILETISFSSLIRFLTGGKKYFSFWRFDYLICMVSQISLLLIGEVNSQTNVWASFQLIALLFVWWQVELASFFELGWVTNSKYLMQTRHLLIIQASKAMN